MKKNLFLLVLAFVACVVGARANELTVVNGRTTTNETIPIYGYYCDAGFINSIVYPADMLSDMEGGVINSLTFYANDEITALQGGEIQVSIGEIEENALTAHATGLTPVFNGIPAKDGMNCVFTFNTPYDYEGGNLVIRIELISKCTNCPHIYFYGEAQDRNTVWHSHGSYSSNGSGVKFLPETTFDYDAATTVEYAAKVTPEKLEFGTVSTGTTSTLNVTLRNSGTNAFTPSVTVTGNGFSTTYVAAELAAKTSTSIPVVFAPTTNGDFTGTVSIDCGHGISFEVPVTGSAANVVTVADGNASSNYLPIYGNWYDAPQMNQMIYPAEKLAAMQGKRLTSMTFYTSATSFFSGGNVAFSLANIDAGTTYPTSGAARIEDDLVEVYSAEPTVAQEWTITFEDDANFIYEGGDLLIDVATQAGTFKSMSFVGETQEDNVAFYSYNNGSLYVQKFLPKVKFTFEDAGEIEPVYSMEVTSSKAIDCGSVIGAGNAVATEKLVVKNTGNQPVKPTIALSGDNAGMFTIEPAEAAELAPRKSAEYTITFTAPEGTEAGEYTANVAITDDNGNAAAIEDVTVKGTVVAPVISGTVTPETLEFTIPAQKTTTGTITIANTGNTSFTPVFSALEAPFSIDEATEIAAGESKNFTVTYAPTEEGTNTATLTVTIGTQEPIAVALNGTATEPTNEVVVCDATNTNQYVPFYSFWADIYLVESQFIYPAEKLTGLNGRKISGIKFFAESNVKATGGQLQVSLKETEQTVFADAGNDKVTEMTVAGTCNIDNNSNTIEFIFNEPIAYNGGNLAVEVVALEKSTGVDKTYWLGESQNTATSYYHYNTNNGLAYFLPKAEFATIPGEQPAEGITLAEMLETGVNDTEYTISNDLAVVEIANNADYAFLTDGENWIRVEFNEENEVAFYNDYIKGGTLKGTLKGIELNPYLVATATPEEGEATVEYEIAIIDLADPFTLKVNQVVDILGYWKEADGALRAYSPASAVQGQSMTVNTDWAGDNITLVDGRYYQIRSAITLKEAWHETTSDGNGTKDYDFDFQNYIANSLIPPSTPTGIDNLNLSNVKSVRYYNVAGIESATPFKGINIVVMEMTDGSKKTVKAVK
ncbi:MAG: choice-of-anchor D domain-containing protein [Muribaculaceae bacterium]|nr:choice-of-anchor D domain-containing protein [Muribaculaceae bacterium]